MADEANTQAVEETQPAVAETTAGDSATQEQTTKVTQETTSSETKENASTGEEKPSAQDAKPEQKPSSRRSAQFRIQELVRENNELKKQVAPKQEAALDEWGNPIEPQEDKSDPKYAKLEAELAELRGMVKPVMTNTQKAADEAEIAEVFTGKPEEKAKYEGRIRAMWELPQYKDLAASDLYAILTARDIEGMIANAKAQAIEEYKKADAEAREASASGSSNTSNRTGGQAKSVMDMSDEEFRAHNERIKAGLPGAQ